MRTKGDFSCASPVPVVRLTITGAPSVLYSRTRQVSTYTMPFSTSTPFTLSVVPKLRIHVPLAVYSSISLWVPSATYTVPSEPTAIDRTVPRLLPPAPYVLTIFNTDPVGENI